MRLRTARGKLKIQHSIIGGLRELLERLLAENPDPTEAEVRFGISGNLCRCTGYQNIVKAILAAAATLNAEKEAAE